MDHTGDALQRQLLNSWRHQELLNLDNDTAFVAGTMATAASTDMLQHTYVCINVSTQRQGMGMHVTKMMCCRVQESLASSGKDY